jgi:hypothetical protein
MRKQHLINNKFGELQLNRDNKWDKRHSHVEILCMSKQPLITRLQLRQEVFIFVSRFRGGYP